MRTLEANSGGLRFELPNYFGSGNAEVVINGKISPGFEINGIAVNLDTIEGVRESGARFLQIRSQENPNQVIKIVEHLISALVAGGIDSAYINIDTQTAPKILGGTSGFIPVVGPGIEPIYSRVRDHSKITIESESGPNHWEVTEKKEFEFNGAKLIIEPSDSLGVYIDTFHKDLADIGAQPLDEQNVLENIHIFSSARPIARLQKWHKNMLFQLLNMSERTRISGISEETYIMGLPGENGDDIAGKMQEQFQEGRNEHLYHTLYADFLGELHLFFPGEFHGKISLINTNHVSRIALLRMLKDSECISESIL